MTLTDQERECAATQQIDLGAGYPQLTLPPPLLEALTDSCRGRVARLTMASGNDRFAVARDLWQRLRGALGLLLGSSFATLDCVATFSGSAAVSRALVAAQRLGFARGRREVELVLLSPSLDVYGLFGAELAQVRINYVSCDQTSLNPDRKRLLQLAERPSDASVQRAFLITSPENPTGFVWPHADLQALAQGCVENGHCLIVDHTFAIAGVQDERAPMIWDQDLSGANVVGLWDTSKTFGLNGEKLGFLLSTPGMAAHVAAAVSVLQLEVSVDQVSTFESVCRTAAYCGYTTYLSSVCRRNLRILVAELAAVGVPVREPSAGTFAIVDLRERINPGTDARLRLLAGGVGVVDAGALFAPPTRPRNILRVALARDEHVFQEGAARIRQVVEPHLKNSQSDDLQGQDN